MNVRGGHAVRVGRAVALVIAMLVVGVCVSDASPAWGAVGSCGPATFGVCLFESPIAANALGESATQAGSHPYAMTITTIFNDEIESEVEKTQKGRSIEDPELLGHIYGEPKHLEVNLPPGLVVNPTVTAKKCTELELETIESAGGGCPRGSVIGVASANTMTGLGLFRSPVYNMVPPSGTPASLGLDFGEIGLIAHVIGNVRTGGDYGLSGNASEIPQVEPLYSIKVTLWGNPSDASHDAERGTCAKKLRVQKELEETAFKEKLEKAIKNKTKLPRESEFNFAARWKEMKGRVRRC